MVRFLEYLIIGLTNFIIKMRKFEVQGVIGMGAYGVVLKAVNKQNKEIVAIKKFKESDQNPIIRKIALREVKALKNA